MRSARFYREREQLALRLDEVIRSCLSADQIPIVNDAAECVYGEFAIGKDPEQREMRFFLGDIAAFTPRLGNALHSLISFEFPKWSIVPHFDDKEFIITAEGVRFSDRMVREPITEASAEYIEWLNDAQEHDTKRFGPMRTQLRYLRPLLPTALTATTRKGPQVVAAFDFYVPYFWDGNPVVWIVIEPELANVGVELTPAELQRDSAVTASGFVFPKCTHHFKAITDEPPAGQLLTFEFLGENKERLTLRTKDGNRSWPIVIPRILSSRELDAQ
jgi:hypothetical protein